MADQELDNQGPETVTGSILMDPIDEAAAPLVEAAATPPQDIMAIPASDINMGAEPNQTIQGPGGAPLVTNADYFGALGGALDMTTLPNQIKTLTGAQYPTAIDSGIPLPEVPATYIPDYSQPAVLAPENQVIEQKVGETSTTQMMPTAGTDAALAGMREGVQGVDQAMQDQAAALTTIAENKALLDEARHNVASDYASKIEQLTAQAEEDLRNSRDTIARLRQEYASQPWQSYWGSKETADKIMLGLAVGLGALSQSQIGGQNLAMAFIQSSIDDHNKAQTERFRNLEAQLNSAQAGSVQVQQAAKIGLENLVAARAAAYDQIEKQLEYINGKASTEAVRARAAQTLNEMRLKNNKELFEAEKELAARTTNRVDIFESKTTKGDPLLFVTREGKPMSESQGKAYNAFLNIAPALKDIEELEKRGLHNTAGYSDYRKALLGELRDFGVLKGPADVAAWLARFDSVVDRVTAGNTDLQLYNRALRKIMVDKLRLDSGASIAGTEYDTFIKTYMPSDITINRSTQSQAINLDQVVNYRRQFLEGYLGQSGSRNRPWYMGRPE